MPKNAEEPRLSTPAPPAARLDPIVDLTPCVPSTSTRSPGIFLSQVSPSRWLSWKPTAVKATGRLAAARNGEQPRGRGDDHVIQVAADRAGRVGEAVLEVDDDHSGALAETHAVADPARE